MKTPVPRLAAIHDLSGFGRAALTVVIPILSTMGIQVCPLPTAVLSTHGAFPGCKFVDLTEQLQEFIAHWKSLGIEFDAIYSGFLGSSRQIDIMSAFIRDFARDDQLVVIDPVLGDDGKLYGITAPNMVEQMRRYIRLADVITPNITEAAVLLGETYRADIEEQEAKDWIVRLGEQGPRMVIITSVPIPHTKKQTAVIAHNRDDGRFWKVSCDYIPAYFPGTGDAFTSVVVGSLLQGDSLPIALDRAVQFISTAIRATFGHQYPLREGVLLERVLNTLRAPIVPSSFEILE
ncbi:pyridoxamine kinase [candidate division KSB3 bacterium]|uniref:pyridoxal kinase n=1 Tax=candidate division KSB3 bacterium TaxID=2044937 RepID=A0A9D5Q838_9BACT|nr:pyridoxamine kinase [candidate division KSB3 bacterium]MBD3327073.1 pyridoxamine kinase [candidate division KSB3 bacterium]